MNGQKVDNPKRSQISKAGTFFAETEANIHVPRALFVDLEDTVTNQLQKGYLRGLFNENLIVSGMEDAADNFARGHYSNGTKTLFDAVDRLRRLSENCDSLQGFVMYHSINGGTGSGAMYQLHPPLDSAP